MASPVRHCIWSTGRVAAKNPWIDSKPLVAPMHLAILTFDGFNELDSLIALGLLNRIKRPDWRVSLMAPTPLVTSMNGVRLERQAGFD